MTKSVKASEARNSLSRILGEVHYAQRPIIIKKQGRPFAVVVSYEQYESLMAAREEGMKVFDKIRSRNKAFSEKEVKRDVRNAIEAVRKKSA